MNGTWWRPGAGGIPAASPAGPGPVRGHDLVLRRSLLDMVQVALVLRLIAFFPVVLGWGNGPSSGPRVAVVAVLVAANGALLLALRRWAPLLVRHPGLVGIDVLLGLGTLLGPGEPGPFLLYGAGSSLIIGLLFPVTGGVLLTLLQMGVSVLGTTVLSGAGGPGAAELSATLVNPLLAAVGWSFRRVHTRLVAVLDEAHAVEQERVREEARDAERARLARAMHDGVAKSLFAITLDATALARHAAGDAEVARRSSALASTAAEASQQARQVLTDLRETVGTVPSLSRAVPNLALSWSHRTGIPVEVEVSPRIGAATGTVHLRKVLLQGLDEALENVARHARATCVRVVLDLEPAEEPDGAVLGLTVTDDGVGVSARQLAGAALDGHFGVVGIRERMARQGGSVTIDRPAGGGTRVRLEIPVPAPMSLSGAAADGVRERLTGAGPTGRGARRPGPVDLGTSL